MKTFLQSVLPLSSNTRREETEIRENACASTEYIIMHGIVQLSLLK